MIRAYYTLAKPGIVYGNALAALAGFLLASKGEYDWVRFVLMLLGLSAIIASGCVFNNYIDRDIDARMERTKNRALVQAVIAPRNALAYGTILFVLGAAILAFYTNALTLGVACFGFFAYVVLYSLLAKRTTPYATHVGALAGAVPPVVGYCAVTNTFDLGALLLFVILCTWQMVHFFAIALYRSDEYAAAGIPVWPRVYGAASTKRQMVGYAALYVVAVALLAAYGYASRTYLVLMLLLAGGWFVLALAGLRTEDSSRSARRMFSYSLVLLLAFCAAVALP